jgi:hypothetical protein
MRKNTVVKMTADQGGLSSWGTPNILVPEMKVHHEVSVGPLNGNYEWLIRMKDVRHKFAWSTV